jgi:uncharacterized protein YuzE
MAEKFAFRVNVENDPNTGRIVAVYFQIRKGTSAKIREHADGALFADYDRRGKLLGIELLAPCTARVLDRIAGESSAKRFVRQSVPRGMLAKT